MIKKISSFCLVGLVMLSLSACQSKPESKTKDTESQEQEITLTVRNPKVEIASQFERLVKVYEKEHSHVNIQVHTVGGVMDNLADLKAQLAAGNGPDIFTNKGYNNAKRWMKYLEDLSDQPWVAHAYEDTLTPMKVNNHIYGMPLNLEGYGFIYNKDLFRKAGIHTLPSTLPELITAAKKLEKTGVTPFATGYYEKWKLGDNLMNIAFAQQEHPVEFIEALQDGKAQIEGDQTFKDLIHLVDVTLKYGNDHPLRTDYTMEMNLFTSGKAAMMIQGNWVQPLIDQRAPNMNIGIFPIPINDQSNPSSLMVDVPNYWVINKQSTPEKKEEAKKFLNWMISSNQGKKFLKEQFKFIPAFQNIKADESNPLAAKILKDYKKGNTVPAHWFQFPVEVKKRFGADMQFYIDKQINREQLLRKLQKSWDMANEN